MHQDLSASCDSSYNCKTDPLEHSPNTSNSWTSSEPEQFPVKMQIPSSTFIPTINAITSSQELQWMVQPAVLGSMSGSCLRPHPYDPLERSSLRPLCHTRLGVIRTVISMHGRNRHQNQLNPEEEEKRRLRRERNKLAAAKCRNRRRELTDQLQGETEELEDEQASLLTQVEELQEERQRLESMLVSHASVCRLMCDSQAQPATPLPPTAMHPSGARPHSRTPTQVKQEPVEGTLMFSLHRQHSPRPPCHHNTQEYHRPPVDCFSASSLAGGSPGQAMDLSSQMSGKCGLEGQDKNRASPREEVLPEDLLSKLWPGNSAMTREEGILAPLFSPTLLAL